jgi:hypothetical protein
MQLPRFRLTIRTIMIIVLISAVVLTIWKLVRETLDPLLSDRSGTVETVWVRSGAAHYFAVVALFTLIAASPFAVAIVLALKSPPVGRTMRRRIGRWVGAVVSLGLGLAILDFPLDGMRSAHGLKDGSAVAFYHQYRMWPGRHVIPCLELEYTNGKSRSYPIAKNTYYRLGPNMRTNADQTVVWFIDDPDARERHGGVWCSINRTTGEFVGAGGPYPAGVSETSGFPF